MLRTVFLFYLTTFFIACGGGDDDKPISESSASPIPTASPMATPLACVSISTINPELTGCGEAGADKTWDSVINQGVTIETFTQEMGNQTLLRRYLQYIPENIDRNHPVPLVFVLHGAGVNAEITRQFDTQTDLENLADEEGFIVIYGNAQAPIPTATDEKFFANSGVWASNTGGNIDQAKLDNDLEYLLRILNKVEANGITLDEDAIFISGISNGAFMTMLAVEHLTPTFRAGFVGVPPPAPFETDEIDASMMFYYSENDPAIAPIFHNTDFSYGEVMGALIGAWALAIGINEEIITNPDFTPIPDAITEGDTYAGRSPLALNSRDSELEQVRARSIDGNNEVWIISSERAGHGIPHPIQFDLGTVETSTGFRNQDVNSMALMWAFFSQFVE